MPPEATQQADQARLAARTSQVFFAQGGGRTEDVATRRPRQSLVLGKASAADARGDAGLTDSVDDRWGTVFNAAAVSTLLGIGAQCRDTRSHSDLVRALRGGASDSIDRAGQPIVERQLSVQQTLTIRAGMPVRVILACDLIVETYGD